ncbi:MAG: ATP-binding cassette domain-containing protein [Candidatus Heimdallarchaeota archaeon]|nr:ATP-binding cassette domain-containing protein [Candidatus Heimdallarchaeota archaeon]
MEDTDSSSNNHVIEESVSEIEEVFPGSPTSANAEVVIEVRNLRKYFSIQSKSLLFTKTLGYIKAVDGIDLQLFSGEVLGLVGESGCGKSTLSKTIVGLEKPSLGQVWYRDANIHQPIDKVERLQIRRNIQMVFQDPYTSLNPRRLIKDTLEEPLLIHHPEMTKEDRLGAVYKILQQVGLESYHGYRYPHEFSGGQRQRVGLARALIMNPEVILADEPVSALDVSVQASILNLMQDLQSEFNVAIIFIAHDLSVVKHVSNRVAVMYLGRIVEIGPTEEVFDRPSHPYTVSLISAIPFADPTVKKRKVILEGDVPSPVNLPPGCRFSSRCYKVQDRCKEEDPILELKRGNTWSACLFPEDEPVLFFEER